MILCAFLIGAGLGLIAGAIYAARRFDQPPPHDEHEDLAQ